jgi:hypothetical protein
MRKVATIIFFVCFVILIVGCNVSNTNSENEVNDEVEDEVSAFEYDMTNDNLSEHWYNIWDGIYKNEGALTDEQIEEINYLLQPIFTHGELTEVNTLSCFFTSYYEDVRDINFTDFLRYFPKRESPKDLPEFDELKSHEVWPFYDEVTFEDMPVPIHRYNREVVQDMFTEYAGISLDELMGVGVDEVLYLESTDAYYNFTSDFAAGIFNCTEGNVKEGIIKLYGSSGNETRPVLTIVKSNNKYVIRSFYKE